MEFFKLLFLLFCLVLCLISLFLLACDGNFSVFLNRHSKGKLLVGWLPLVVGGGVLYLLSRRTKSLLNLEYRFGIPRKIRIEGQYMVGELPISFDNASPQKISFSKVYLRLEHEGKGFGNVYLEPKAELQPRSLTEVPFVIKAPIASIISVAGKSILTGGTLPVKVVGTINAEGGNIFIDKALELQIPGMNLLTNLISGTSHTV